jgi:CheY-like chemotaxis protein
MKRVWLVAEDNAATLSMLKMLLTLWEVDGLFFENGDQVWLWLDEVEQGVYQDALPEVALLDLRMSGHDGDEIGQRMRSIEATQGIPLILATAFDLTRKDKADIEAIVHADQLILKPFPSLDKFRELIEETIEASKREHSLAAAVRFTAEWQPDLNSSLYS